MRNIVICCDGTGNEIEEHQSNVLKFYRTLTRDDDQIVFYDPGVGTISEASPWAQFLSKLKGVAGLALGIGLDANVLDAYRFLIRNYRAGDRIWLFGYSRGAYTARVLGGLIYSVGVLKPEQENLCTYALVTYKRSKTELASIPTWRFRRVLGLRRPEIHFMGCWDTVGSVIVPRLRELRLPTTEDPPFTKENPIVRHFRHALALDEKRRMFRVYPWKVGQDFMPRPPDEIDSQSEYIGRVNADRETERKYWERQDSRQVWFAGVHGDIGGGYPENESGPAKLPLKWMVDEARSLGLRFEDAEVAKLVEGRTPDEATESGWRADRHYRPPSPTDPLHDSFNFAWKLLEYLPKRAKWREWLPRRAFFKLYLPRKEPRVVPDGHELHPSVQERQTYGEWRSTGQGERKTPAAGAPYRPVNLPDYAPPGN